MVRIRNIALPATWDEALLRKKAARALGVPVGKLHRCVPVRQSIDARKKGDVHYVMTVDVSLPHEEAVVARGKGNQISLVEPPVPYAFPQVTRVSTLPPVVVAAGRRGCLPPSLWPGRASGRFCWNGASPSSSGCRTWRPSGRAGTWTRSPTFSLGKGAQGPFPMENSPREPMTPACPR